MAHAGRLTVGLELTDIASPQAGSRVRDASDCAIHRFRCPTRPVPGRGHRSRHLQLKRGGYAAAPSGRLTLNVCLE